jgi:hypothetical protein
MNSGAVMWEYELYVPLFQNDGEPVEPTKLAALKQRLIDEFGGLTHFPQENEGFWKVGHHTFRDRVVILRVLSHDKARATHVFHQLKEHLKRDWGQKDVLIVVREVNLL